MAHRKSTGVVPPSRARSSPRDTSVTSRYARTKIRTPCSSPTGRHSKTKTSNMNRKTPSDPASDILGMDGLRRHLRQVSGLYRELVTRTPLYFFAGMLACMLSSVLLPITVIYTDATHELSPFP